MVDDAQSIENEAHHLRESVQGFIADHHFMRTEIHKRQLMALRDDMIHLLNGYDNLIKDYEEKLSRKRRKR